MGLGEVGENHSKEPIKKSEKFTGKTKLKESTGRGPYLQAIDNPFLTRSKRLKDGLSLSSPSPTVGINSQTTLISSVAITRNAVAISSAQLHKGEAEHFESCTIVS